MSSDRDRKGQPEGTGTGSEPPPPAGERPSSRAPSAWGAARDALASVHNLEALLRNERVPSRTIGELVPELRVGAGVLRQAFVKAHAAGDAAAVAVGTYGLARVDALDALLDAAASSSDKRERMAGRARVLEEELEASADLLAVLERAVAPSPTEVSADLLVRETGRLWGSGRGRELSVRFDAPAPDGVIRTDPYVAGPLLALLVAHVHAAGAPIVVVRARCTQSRATFVIAPGDSSDAARPVIAMRVMPSVPPTERAARRVAEQIGADLEWAPTRGMLALSVVP
jgi:hypothetical protein